jgi:hypothetical protein
MVLIVNIPGLVIGAGILMLSLVNLYAPGFAVDPLVAKNMIYFFGHVFINATIYMSVIAVYEILPVYAHQPVRLCAYYRINQQAVTGRALIAVAAASGLLWLLAALFGWRRHRPAAIGQGTAEPAENQSIDRCIGADAWASCSTTGSAARLGAARIDADAAVRSAGGEAAV